MDDIAKHEEDASIFGNLSKGETPIPVITNIFLFLAFFSFFF